MDTGLHLRSHLSCTALNGNNPRITTPIANFLAKVYCYLVLLLLLPASLLAQERLVGLTSIGGVNNGGTAFNILSNGTGFTVSHAFTSNGGYYPYGDLTKGNDGNYYGLTYGGGTNGTGTVFQVTTTGAVTIIKNLDNVSGTYPEGSLVKGTDGNFYSTGQYGGSHSVGTIFKITPSGTVTVLKNMSVDTTGSYPRSGLVLASDGNFYGMTYQGGAYKYGTIFKITPSGTFTRLKSFDLTTGGYPQNTRLVQGSDGFLYGMTTSGGTNSAGVIFKISTSGSGYKVLRNLNAADGYYPYGGLIQATDGGFYGMTSAGGTTGYGTIFRITSGGSFSIKKNLAYSTTGGAPHGDLVQGSDGLLYGMTYYGGTNSNGTVAYGTIFKMTTGGSLTVLKTLAGGTATGIYPYGNSLVQGSDGAFYGMTYQGGSAANGGTVFKITSSGSYTLLSRFPDGGRGYFPHESLVQALDGNYYGTAYQGGSNGYGTIYKLCTGGSFTTLHSFAYATTGAYPEGSLVQGKDGNFYGTASYYGGSSNYGTIYKMTPGGTVTVLKRLDGTTTGSYPHGSLVAANDSTFYGMTTYGGTNNYGTIFKVTKGVFAVVKQLASATTGGQSFGSLVKGKDGNLYGMTYVGGTSGYGTIFKLTPGGTLSVIKNLAYATGGNPYGNSLIQGSDGYFYGMTTYGGASGYGTIFKVNASGSTYVVLKSFDNTTTGGYPYGDLVQGPSGTLYGLTYRGGTYDGGTIFKISTSGGGFAVLRHLKKEKDGANPSGSLVVQKAGPKAVTQSVTTAEDVAKTITLSGTGGTPLTYAISTAPKNGTLSGSGATRTYTPKANYNGKDSFYFTVTWGCQTSASAKVLITVTKVNDAPVLTHIGNKTVVKGNTLTFTATATDVDAGQTKTFSLVGAPAGATIGASSGVFSWTPAVTGSFVFKVRVTDNGSPVLYDEEAITVTVTSTTLTSITKNEKVKTDAVQGLTLMVSPNPSTSYFIVQIKSSRTEAVTLNVTDALGRTVDVKTGLSPNGTVLLGYKYTAGTYIVQAQQGELSTAVKLLKQ